MKLTAEEEFIIIRNTESYIELLRPDRQCYFYDGIGSTCNIKSNVKTKSPNKRKSYSNLHIIVDNFAMSQNLNLEMGTKLLEPKCKLIELVSYAVADSPHGILTARQIYMCLQ
ncbi:hypothetical protein A3Q56_06664 [Intoshia linei]|uniref:Uncharacterized protein n=1 Tax=Intoshia linei TaxID=1819745 RepID=A0A177AUW4_9BILA|nr:hypothetical protein A3Q56_06664 [Intoshia linei]